MTAPAAEVHEERLTISSDLLGPITVAQAEIIRFPGGLYGFPECHAFVLLPTPREAIFWLQSTEFSALSFILADPFVYFSGYHIELEDADIARIGSSDPQHVLVLSIVTMPSDKDGPCTANLHAPLLFNMADRNAFQSIRPDDGYGVREPFFMEHAVNPAPAT